MAFSEVVSCSMEHRDPENLQGVSRKQWWDTSAQESTENSLLQHVERPADSFLKSPEGLRFQETTCCDGYVNADVKLGCFGLCPCEI